MPIYVYRCPLCKHEEEIQKKFSEMDRVEPCPKCVTSDPKKQQTMERQVINKTSFSLKGGGWFKSPGGY